MAQRKPQPPLDAARQKLVSDNMWVVYWVTNQMFRRKSSLVRRMSRDEATASATLGLVIAASRFDFSRNLAFSTYAKAWIINQIQKDSSCLSSAISTPLQDFNFDAVTKYLTSKTLKKAYLARKTVAMPPPFHPNMPITNIEDSPLNNIIRDENVALAREIITMIPEIYSIPIRLYLDGIPITEISKKIGITRETVRKRIRLGLKKLAIIEKSELPLRPNKNCKF